MKSKALARQLMLCEAVGFAMLVSVSWMDELLDLPSLLFGGTPGHNWHEALLETAIIIAAAVPTIVLSRRLARWLVFLEDFLRVGAWCHKIGMDDKWVSMEAYLYQELQVTAIHGMCPECFKNLEKHLGEAA